VQPQREPPEPEFWLTVRANARAEIKPKVSRKGDLFCATLGVLENKKIKNPFFQARNLICFRLKQTGACWRKERANKIVILAALLYSDQWKHAWNNST